MSGSSGSHRTSSRPASTLSSTFSKTSSSLLSHRSNASNFQYKHGSRLHAFRKDEVPYPFSYDRDVLELNPMDRALINRTRKSVSFIDFGDKPPKRCLDLGCGLGDWVIDAAKTWPDCTFVGFDLVDIQINLDYVDASIANRIRWVHGNFLERLPFDDGEFDHVRMSSIAFGVPEDKWYFFFDEIRRVTKTGGHVEEIEEDATFPILPRWFTEPLRRDVRRSSMQSDMSAPPSPVSYTPPEDLPHDYALLEMLFNSVFDNRFINSKPCSILPGYFSATFTRVISPPILYFPMPPLAPLPPLSYESVLRPMKELDMHARMLPHLQVPRPLPTPVVSTKPNFSMILEECAASTTDLTHIGSIYRTESKGSLASHASKSSGSYWSHSERPVVRPSLAEEGESIQIGGQAAYKVYDMESLFELDDHGLFMHLHRAVGLVYAAKEAMWEELRALVVRADTSLVKYGWLPHEYVESVSRKKFDALWDHYRADMHERIALWHPMVHYGWAYPRQSPMTESEIVEQEQMRKAILDARLLAKEEDIQPQIRVVRTLVGINELSPL